MKKRISLFLALTALIGSGAFAQTNFVSAELSFLGIGARYEKVITPYITISGYGYFNFLPTPFIDSEFSESHSLFALGLAGRWYPAGRRFFTELGLGYVSFESNRKRDYEYSYYNGYQNNTSHYSEEVTDKFPGFSIAPGFGWTVDVGKAGGFFISPGIKVPFIITSQTSDMGLGEGIYFSVIASLGFGFAF
jgi:hypothetical protein